MGDALGADVRAQVSERVASTEKKSLAAQYDPEVVEAALALREGKIDEGQFAGVYFRCLRDKDEVYGRFEVSDEIADGYEDLVKGELSFEEYEDIYNSELERGENIDKGDTRDYNVNNGKATFSVSNWHPNITKGRLEVLKRIIRRDIKTSGNQITETANWIECKIDGQNIFAIYSTEHLDSPTLLYAVAKEQAEFEKIVCICC